MPDTEIIIVAPDSANAGDTVPVEVKITNISAGTIDALPGFCYVNGGQLFVRPIDELFRTLGPGQSASWYDDFTMPGFSVTVDVGSWWENAKVLHQDIRAEKNIELTEGGPIVPQSQITIDAPSSAAAGETVNFSVTVKNTHLQYYRIFEIECWAPDQLPEHKVIEIRPGERFDPGESKTYPASFVMPNKNAEIFVWITWFYFPQYIDDNWALQVVGVTTGPPPPQYTLTVSVSPDVGGIELTPDKPFYYEENVGVRAYVDSFMQDLYEFDYLIIDGGPPYASPVINIYLGQNHTVVAYFKEIAVSHEGTITRKELKYDTVTSPIPVS